MMKVKLKKLHNDAVIPSYGKPNDVGLDLTATSVTYYPEAGEFQEYGTGLAIEIPEGYGGFIFPRSSVTTKKMMLKNSVGIIDPGYRGEIKCRFIGEQDYKVGDRVAQLVILPVPRIEFEEVEDLSSTERGIGGFGSTGK